MLQSGDFFATAAGKLPFAPAIMSGALSFVRLCLEESAGVREEDRLTGSTLSPVSLYLAGLVTPGLAEQTCIDQYLELLVQSLGPAGGRRHWEWFVNSVFCSKHAFNSLMDS